MALAVYRKPYNPATVVVAPEGSTSKADYYTDGTDDQVQIQAAIDSLGSGGGKILLKQGTYSLGAGLTFALSNLIFEGEGPTSRINFNSASTPIAFKMADTSQRSNNRFKNFRISQQGTAGTGVAFEFSYFAQSLFENITTDGSNGGFLGNAGGTLYNRFYNCTANVSGVGSYGYKTATTSNECAFYSCRTIGTSDTTGFIVAAHSTKMIDFCAEGISIGIDLQASGDDCTIVAPYLELNATNIKIAADVEATTVLGGVIIDGTTYNIQNLGGKGLAFINVRLQYEQFNYREPLNSFVQTRWIRPFHESLATTSQTATAGRVYLLECELVNDAFVDAVTFVKGSTIAGNVRVGVYGPIVTEETPEAAPLLVESASTAMAAGVNTEQVVALTKTKAKAGRYYIAFQSDDNTATYMRHANQTQVVGWGYTYDRGGGYGAFTTPCPTASVTGSALPAMRIRCAPLTTV